MKQPIRCDVIYHFDVWGNAKDGFEVNDSRKIEMDLDLTSSRSMLKDLRREFKIKPGSVKIEEHYGSCEINGLDGRPFLTINAIIEG